MAEKAEKEQGTDLEKALDESLDALQKAAKGEELSKSSAEEEDAKGKSEEDEDAKGKKDEEDAKGDKKEDEDAKGGEKGEEEDEDEDEEAKKKGFRKSVEERMEKSETVKNGIEVSKFLGELVKSLAAIVGEQTYRINRLEKSNKALGEALVKSFGAQNDVIKSFGTSIDSMGSRPLPRKSVDGKAVTTLEKGFRNNADGKTSGAQELTKSEIASKMADLEIGGKLPAGTTSKFEMTGEMSKSVESLVLGA